MGELRGPTPPRVGGEAGSGFAAGGAHDWGVQRRCAGRGVRPFEAGRQGDQGVEPPKSNWALAIDTPPFSAYRVTGGITYTFGGLKINTRAQVLDTEDRPIPGLYAAGEIVGGFFYFDSLRASGLMHGAVFGQLRGPTRRGIGEWGRAPTRDAPTEEGRGRQWNGRIAGANAAG